MPLAKAWPEAPRIENAVMFVPNSDSRKTVGPERAAGQEVLLGARGADLRGAKREDADVEHEPPDRRRRPRPQSFVARAGSVVEVRRPEQPDEHHEDKGRGHRVGGMVEEADRQDAEHERACLAPEPEVLVQGVQHGHEQRGGSAFSCGVRSMYYHTGPERRQSSPPTAILRCYACPPQSAFATASAAQVQAARDALDAQVREVVAWHFDPATGCPFWLDYAKRLGWDPADRDQRSSATCKRLGSFEDEWLRGGPVQRWVPRGPGRQAGVRLRDRRHDRHARRRASPATTSAPTTSCSARRCRTSTFPKGANWLMLGPSGPRRLRLAVEHLAQYRGGICFCVDLDPRWVIKLIKKGWSEHLQAYKDHVIDQAVTILQANHDIRCMFTTPKLLEALALRLESMGTTIRKVGITGIFSGGTEFTPQWNRFAHEELLDGAYMTPTYGNTLMGLAASAPSGPHNNYKIAYYAPQPRAGIEVVDFDDPDRSWTTGRRAA